MNEFQQSEIIEKYVQSKISPALLQLLINNQVQFVWLRCYVLPDVVVQIKNFSSLVLFSAVFHKRRGKKLISETIQYKLECSSKMRFAFFYPKDIQKFVLENYRFCRKSGNDANSRGLEGEEASWSCSLRHYDAVRRKIDMWFTPNCAPCFNRI